MTPTEYELAILKQQQAIRDSHIERGEAVFERQNERESGRSGLDIYPQDSKETLRNERSDTRRYNKAIEYNKLSAEEKYARDLEVLMKNNERREAREVYLENLERTQDELAYKNRRANLEIVPEKGAALVEGMAMAALPIAVHYANQATHGEFNPLDIKSAGEGSEVEANHEQSYNSLKELYKQKQLETLR